MDLTWETSYIHEENSMLQELWETSLNLASILNNSKSLIKSVKKDALESLTWKVIKISILYQVTEKGWKNKLSSNKKSILSFIKNQRIFFFFWHLDVLGKNSMYSLLITCRSYFENPTSTDDLNAYKFSPNVNQEI